MIVKSIILNCFVFFVSFFLPFKSFATGIFGEYTLLGKVISKNGKLLKNSQILIYFGSKKDTLLTNSDGVFRAQIPWSSTCNSRKKRWISNFENLKTNPRFIRFKFKNSNFKFKNDWKKYKQLRNSECCKIIVKFD